jgi:hypothetical protein
VVVEFAPVVGEGHPPFEPEQLAFNTSGYIQMELLGLERSED